MLDVKGITRRIPVAHMIQAAACLAMVVAACGTAAAQGEWAGGGYIVYEEVDLPPLAVEADMTEFPQSPSPMNVKAIGMGRTQVANGHRFNAMLDNPALLARERFTIDLIGLQAGIPVSTLDAAKFVRDNQDEFENGGFYTLVRDGYDAYNAATTVQERLDAIAIINRGLVFPNELLTETVGHQDDPNTHGVSVVPAMQIQWGRWGAALYATGQVGFSVTPGNTLDQLLSVQIPADAQELTPEVLRTLGSISNSVFDANGELVADGLPQAFALTYFDVVGAVGYARQYRPDLELGVNLKVLHRRFSTKNIDAENLDEVIEEAQSDLDESVTGLTADLGALYQLGRRGTQVGLAVQNLIPVKEIRSAARFSFLEANSYYLLDAGGQPYVGVVGDDGTFYEYAAGDTLLSVENERVEVASPFELTAPLLVNAGIWHPLARDWDVSLDWVDIFSQDDKYESYASRFRVGTEYRLLKGMVALRGGVADEHLALGAGLDLKLLQLDGAYAYDNFVGEHTYYLQAKIGW